MTKINYKSLSLIFLATCAIAHAAGPVAVNPAPWADGERIKMKILSPKDCKPLGNIIFSADKILIDKKPAWRIESHRYFTNDNTQEFTRVDALRDNFIPLAAVTNNKDGDFNTVYDKSKITVTAVKNKKCSVSTTGISGAVYDVEQILHLVRRLPLIPGYKTSFKVFSSTEDALATCKIEVGQKIENTKWAGGQMPCYVVDIRAYVFFIKVEEHRLWVSTDPNHWPVRHTAEDNILELTDFSAKSKESPDNKPGGRKIINPQ